MLPIEKIAEFTYDMARVRFKNVAVSKFEIAGNKYSSVDVLSSVKRAKPQNIGRIQADRYVFDANGKFVSRNVLVKAKSGYNEIVTVSATDGFGTIVTKRSNLGEYTGSKLIITNSSSMSELRGDNGVGGFSGFISRLIAKFKPGKVDGDIPVNIKIIDDSQKGQSYAIHAEASNGDVLIKGREEAMRVIAKEFAEKVPILTEIFLNPGRIETGEKIASFLEKPLQKLKSFEKL